MSFFHDIIIWLGKMVRLFRGTSMDMLAEGDYTALPSAQSDKAEIENQVRTLVDATPDLGMSGGTVYVLSDFPAERALREIRESRKRFAASAQTG